MGMFEISDMGLISTATADLDRETTSSFTLNITASDYGTPVLSNTTIVNVSLVDVNDNPPLFEMTTDNIFVEVDDMNAVPAHLYSVKATDEDLSPFDIIQCEQQTDKSFFLVLTSEDGSCDVYSVRQLDASTEPYKVIFDAFNPDRPDEMRSNNFTLNVNVRDTACYITFDPATQDDLLLEESQLDSSVAVLDLNVTSNCDVDVVVYNITEQMYQPDSNSSSAPSAYFTIDSTDGTIFPVDGVSPGAHELVVVAWNESDTTVNDTTSVVIVVTGENSAPYFRNAEYNVKINSTSGEVIDLFPEVVNSDSPSFATGEIDFSEISEVNEDGENTEYFTVSAEGMVSLTAGNQVVNDVYNLTVRVQDRALEPLSNDTLVIIEVDIEPIVDPAAPYISKNCSDEIHIEEWQGEEAIVICFVTASSSYDEVVEIRLEDDLEHFSLVSNTGEISIEGPIDYETDPNKFQLLIYAEGATSKLRNYTTITVIVDDINDNAPVLYGLPKELFVKEDERGKTNCNQVIGTFKTMDDDSKNNSQVVYQTGMLLADKQNH
ncbi:cadherin EGF LAG seven-pass G-type receptor fmi-1-like [Diadema setosum]|uniref:cadherin EGF LAG seven-pass G-type receptor fmi-1-like n=1 Tax=Diadema setosum TaxID=31175 RepID=UPI003B3ACAB0